MFEASECLYQKATHELGVFDLPRRQCYPKVLVLFKWIAVAVFVRDSDEFG